MDWNADHQKENMDGYIGLLVRPTCGICGIKDVSVEIFCES